MKNTYLSILTLLFVGLVVVDCASSPKPAQSTTTETTKASDYETCKITLCTKFTDNWQFSSIAEPKPCADIASKYTGDKHNEYALTSQFHKDGKVTESKYSGQDQLALYCSRHGTITPPEPEAPTTPSDGGTQTENGEAHPENG